MGTNKKYYWLKLPRNFFSTNKEVKRLRKLAGGDTYTIIYLKMLLLSLETDGMLYFDGIDEDFISELALDIDEETDDVTVVVQFLTRCGLLVQMSEDEYLLTSTQGMVGSETDSAHRVREHRERKSLQCNTDVTICNTEKEIEKEKEIDTEIEIEEEKEKEKEPKAHVNYQEIVNLFHSICKSYPQVNKISENRKKAIKARLNTYSIEEITEVFERAEASDFLKGKNDRNWSASFDWLMKDSNMAKVLDGNYENKGKVQSKALSRAEEVFTWV